ncbi:MAG: GAF domain-containing protein [Pseudomonadota bacterium]
MLFQTRFSNEHNRGLIYRFNVIGILTIFLPVFIVSYIIYDTNISLDYSHLVILAMALLLMLAGLTILRYVFDTVLAVVDILRKSSVGDDAVPLTIKQDVSDMKEISASFSRLMDRLEKTTEALDRRVYELNAIKEMTDIARKTLHVDELLKAVLEKAMAVVRAKVGSVFTVDTDSKRLRLVVSIPEGTLPNGSYINIDESALKHVVEDRKTMIIQDIETDPRTQKPNDPKYGSPSFLSMPIFTNHSMIAVLNLADKGPRALFEEHDEQVLSIMLGEVSFALENAILHSKIREQLDEIIIKKIALEQEITERKRIEENLQKVNVEIKDANDKLTAAYEWMRESRDRLLKHQGKEEIGFIVDREGKIDGITERALECTGKSRVELIGHNIMDFIDEICYEEFKSELRQAWMGITRNFQIVMMQPYESERIFDVTLTRLTSESRRSLLVVLR